MNAPSLPNVEVVVCTHNRARLLEPACESILAQDYPAERWRLVIVDNASTDTTFAVAESLARNSGGRVHAVQEPRTGHSMARNAGIRATTAEIIAFTDDDALPDPAWLRTLITAMTEQKASAAGGPVDPIVSGQLPSWFLPEFYFPYLAVWRPSAEVLKLAFNEYPRGVNMAFRREVFERLGSFSTSLGLQGNRQRYCEETEMFLRIERNGGTILYSPDSIMRHRVEAGRLTTDWISRRFAAQGRSEAILNWMHGGFRGLRVGSRVHRASLHAVPWQSLREIGGGRSDAELKQAAEILTHCRRLALAGYLRQAPIAAATVPRYRRSASDRFESWVP